MRKAAMSILPVKFILFCLIAVICLGTMPGSAESNPGSSRMVNVADGVSLRVIESGKAGGEPALVFIPGWSIGADIWNHQIDTFAKTHRVTRSIRVRKVAGAPGRQATCPNWMVAGRSGRRCICRALREQRPRGNCAGGCRHFGWSRWHCRSTTGNRSPIQDVAVYQAHQKEYLGGMMRAIISKPGGDDAIARLVETGMKTPADIGVAMLIADMFGVNRTPALKKIDCPTLIIASAKSDELARQQAAANQIPHARLEKIEDAAHAVFIDQPDRFDELLKSFVAKLPANNAPN